MRKGPNICPLTGKPKEDCGGCQFLRMSHYKQMRACSLSIFEYEKNNGSSVGFQNYLRVILNTVSVGNLDPPVEADPTDDIHKKELHEALDRVLSTLTDRERQILEMRFGLMDGNTHTLEEVGKSLHITRERVRQIEAKAIRKLRHPTRMRKLSGLL